MKITTLINKLQKLANKNPKLEVILASDMEGNDYNLLNEVSYYKGDSFYSFELKEFWQNEGIPDEHYKEVVVLYP